MPATTQQLPNPIGLPALRRPVMMPRHREHFLTGSLEQRVVDRDGQRRSGRQEVVTMRSVNANPTVSLDQRATPKKRCARL
jgi:hypothetical protein